MIYFERGSETDALTQQDLEAGLHTALDALGERRKVVALPPDITRFHSHAGVLTEIAWRHYGDRLTDILPAIGTHSPMTAAEISRMFGDVPQGLFRVHDWRNNLTTLGRVPSSVIRELSEGRLDYDWPAQVNDLLVTGGHDLILSLGQVVPHEVVGMANFNKNIFVGTGGQEGINKSHYLGAVYGMERMMGRADTPVRRVLNYASTHFAADLPIVYVQTVVGTDANGRLVVRGLYVGDDEEVFHKAARLSLKVNFTMLDVPIRKAVVYLDPEEFRSTWLGNKAIYRTRMAIEDDGELLILGPGVKEFGEDPEIDRLIRKYGYHGTPATLKAVEENEELQQNLSAAAHLIHGSSEGRFTVTLAAGHLSRDEVTSAGFKYDDPGSALSRYNPETLRDGWNNLDGERIFYVSNPALGLWAHRDRFSD